MVFFNLFFLKLVGKASEIGATLILFLNKIDLFEEKMSKAPEFKAFTTQYPKYTGELNDTPSATKYITNQFKEESCIADNNFFSHVMCATDTKIIKSVFETVRGQFITDMLSNGII